MPPVKTVFNPNWLKSVDRNGQVLSSWCRPDKNSKFSAFCEICNKTIKCDNQGLRQLLQHSSMVSHKSLSGEIADGKQLVLQMFCWFWKGFWQDRLGENVRYSERDRSWLERQKTYYEFVYESKSCRQNSARIFGVDLNFAVKFFFKTRLQNLGKKGEDLLWVRS